MNDNNHEGTLSAFLTTQIYYAYLTSVGYEHSVRHESLIRSLYIYIYIIYICYMLYIVYIHYMYYNICILYIIFMYKDMI